MSWSEIQLGEAIHVKHGFAFKGEFFAPEGNLMVVTPGNFLEPGGFRVRAGKERFYTGDFPESYLLAKDDLIVAMTEQGEGLLGSAARIPEDDKYLHNQRIGLVAVTDAARLDKGFLYWLLNSKPVRAQIRGSSTGTKVRHTAPERIYKVRVNIPNNLYEQAKIAETLDRYDDLIETNYRRITLLEESARLLYLEWFVKLRFADHERVKVHAGVPQGWELKPLSAIADFVNGFAFKPAHFQEEGLPIVKIPELRDGVSEKTPRNDGGLVPEKNKIDTGDMLFSWSGTLLVNEWSEGPALLNQHLFRVVPCVEFAKRYLRLALEESLPALRGQSVGATMMHIRKSALDEHKVFLPPEGLRRSFCNLIDPVMDQVLVLRAQIKTLKLARDELLPKLMSGEIQV